MLKLTVLHHDLSPSLCDACLLFRASGSSSWLDWAVSRNKSCCSSAVSLTEELFEACLLSPVVDESFMSFQTQQGPTNQPGQKVKSSRTKRRKFINVVDLTSHGMWSTICVRCAWRTILSWIRAGKARLSWHQLPSRQWDEETSWQCCWWTGRVLGLLQPPVPPEPSSWAPCLPSFSAFPSHFAPISRDSQGWQGGIGWLIAPVIKRAD